MEVLGYIKTDTGLRCPTEICHAECCQVADPNNKMKPCPFLRQDDFLCGLQADMGIDWKPQLCRECPQKQKDIDVVNRIAEVRGSPYRCQLRVVGE